MKIAILSMQRIANYGSFLQAYSLKKILENMGHDVEFLDILPGRQLPIHENAINHKKISIFRWIISKFDNIIFKRIYHLFFHIIFIFKYENCWLPILGISKSKKFETDADLVIIGSDEVFNFAQKSSWGFSPQLFGKINKNKKIISYAASCGFSTYKDAEKANIIHDLREALNNMSAISVRDQNSKEFISKIINKEPIVHIDPTIAYNLLPDAIDANISFNYLLLYSYAGRTNSKAEINTITLFAKKHGLKILSVGTYHPWVDKNIIASPLEVLTYFRKASYIVTDTFHGTIFSIINNKQFCTIFRDSNTEKLHSLLSQFGLEDRELPNISLLDELLVRKIDYSKVNKIIDKEKKRSIDFLASSISNNCSKNEIYHQ